MRVLVCGGRDYEDRVYLFKRMDEFHRLFGISLLIHGDSRGADRLAEKWAMQRGIAIARYPAQWKRDGNKAGPLRNRLMLASANPELVIAFPGGPGTQDMMDIARAAGVKVIEVSQ